MGWWRMNTAERKAFAETIRPTVKGKSDKFSWRLYQRALKRGRERVYLMAWDSVNGYRPPSFEVLKGEHVPAIQIALGQHDAAGWFHGNCLRSICTPGSAKHDWAYGPGHHVSEWIEITDWFWSNYLRVGRCLFWKYEHHWIEINRNARKCEYCGKHERRQVVTRRKIERKEVWA